MKIIKILTEGLERFRYRTNKHIMSFKWTGSYMVIYQNGVKLNLTEIFSGCFMPKKEVMGFIYPEDIAKFIEVQQFIYDNMNEILISPAEWGYDIYKIVPKSPNPVLVHELRFYSIKSKWATFTAKLFKRSFRIAYNNIK